MYTSIILGQLGLAFAAFVVIFRAMVIRLEGLGLISRRQQEPSIFS